eukprot:2776341-Prymnesium_polylepis.1
MACGLWCAVRRYPALRALCGAVSVTRCVSMRGLIGSRLACAAHVARRPVRLQSMSDIKKALH